MESIERYCVAAFATTHAAVSSEKKLLSEGLAVKMIPVPPEISASCGLALKFDEGILPEIKRLLADIGGCDYYDVTRTSGKRSAVQID